MQKENLNLDLNNDKLLFRYNSKLILYRIYSFIVDSTVEDKQLTSLINVICFFCNEVKDFMFNDLMVLVFNSKGDIYEKVNDLNNLDGFSRILTAVSSKEFKLTQHNFLQNRIMNDSFINNSHLVYSGVVEFNPKNQTLQSIKSDIDTYLFPIKHIINPLFIDDEKEQKQNEIEADQFLGSIEDFLNKSKIILNKGK